jgi:hypothetical protein
VAEREVFFARHLAAELALDVLAGDLHRRARPDIIRADQIEALAVLGLGDPVEAGEDLLGGFLTGIDHVLGLLETFIEGRVVEHAVILLHDRQHRLAGGRGPAAHDGGDLVIDQQLLGLFSEGRPVRGTVFLDELDLAAEHAAHGVDLVDGELFSLNRAGFRDRHRTGDRMQNADGDFRIGNRKAGGIDGRGGRRLRKRCARKQRHCRQSRHAHQQFTPQRRVQARFLLV